MRARARQWCTVDVAVDRVAVSDVIDQATGQPAETTSRRWSGQAHVRQAVAAQSRTTVREFGIRDLRVWVDDTASVETGDRFTVLYCPDDQTLNGVIGTVTDVDRDPIRAVRRFTVRLVSDG
jgi:hypothetical protein